jgi:hypothetical protein
VYELARVYDATTLIARAVDLDDGFDLDVFASMLDALARFTDNDIPVVATDVADLRSFFARWAAGLCDR